MYRLFVCLELQVSQSDNVVIYSMLQIYPKYSKRFVKSSYALKHSGLSAIYRIA